MSKVSCILSCSYIKPQPAKNKCYNCVVVYYHVPTSNHNGLSIIGKAAGVVYYHVPTSNHNQDGRKCAAVALYIIMFLHQTTTGNTPRYRGGFVVYYHVPTSNHNWLGLQLGLLLVVYYHVPTSNHNLLGLQLGLRIVVYYHVPTSNHNL